MLESRRKKGGGKPGKKTQLLPGPGQIRGKRKPETPRKKKSGGPGSVGHGWRQEKKRETSKKMAVDWGGRVSTRAVRRQRKPENRLENGPVRRKGEGKARGGPLTEIKKVTRSGSPKTRKGGKGFLVSGLRVGVRSMTARNAWPVAEETNQGVKGGGERGHDHPFGKCRQEERSPTCGFMPTKPQKKDRPGWRWSLERQRKKKEGAATAPDQGPAFTR